MLLGEWELGTSVMSLEVGWTEVELAIAREFTGS